MTKKQKKTLIRISIGAVFYILAIVFPTDRLGLGDYEKLFGLGLMLIPYFIIGGDVLYRAVRNILHGQVFDENFLMALATVGAFFTGEYLEGVAVMLFYQVGELFQSYAVGLSRQSITKLMDIRPDYANVEYEGALEKVDPEDVAVGDLIVVKAGEKVPLDGVIVAGSSLLDTSAPVSYTQLKA